MGSRTNQSFREGIGSGLPVYTDIFYIEVIDHVIYYHTKNHVLERPGSMKKTEELYQKLGFCRIHQSYLVNMDKIEMVLQGKILLENKADFLMLIGAVQSILVRKGMLLATDIFPEFDDSYLAANQYLISSYVEGYFLLETGLFFLYGKYKYDKYEYSLKEKGILSVMFLLLLLEGICCKNQKTERQIWQMLALLQCSLFLFILIDAYIMQTYKKREQEKFHSGIKNQILYYESIEKNQQEVYKLYHDMKNHLLVLNVAESIQEKYIDQCMNRIRATEGHAETGITYVDVLLNDKWRKAQENGIDMSFSVQRDALEKIEIFDLTVLLGNLLDNALEAAKKVTDKRAAISLKSGKNGGCIFIHITNDYKEEPYEKNGEFQTIKKDKKYHGRGFKNVKEVVQKYGGELKTEYNGRRFSVIILLYI